MGERRKDDEGNGLSEMRAAIDELQRAISFVRDSRGVWQMPPYLATLPTESSSWNFTTFEKYINQRFTDLSLQLRERYEAQQTGVIAALAAAEKAVNAALIAAEKAVDKAEGAQALRNDAQNEFRKALGDLSALMWTTTAGQAAVDSLRREYLTGHKVVEERIGALESATANIQGRIWAVSAIWAFIVVAVSIGVRFIH